MFNHNGDDSQVKVNKNASGDTASHLFQTGFSGRAEFGLIGDDHYQVKVSSDGSAWFQSYVVTNSSGNIDFKQDVNITGSLTGVELDGLDGVVFTSPTTGQLLKYDGTNWINDTVSGASSTLDALDDTNLSTPSDGDFLVFDGTDWVNEAGATARTSLGLGSIATQASTGVNIDGGNIDGTAIGASSASSINATTLDISDEFTCNDNLVTRAKLKDYSESRTAPSSSSGTLTLDLENGNIFEVTLTENVTTTNFNNPPAIGNGGSFTLILKQDSTGGRTFTWPLSVDWSNGISPTLSTAANTIDVLTFLTVDGGTTWYGFLSGVNFS